jgi:protocatechuate 3,4-dioxygenase beta subunit
LSFIGNEGQVDSQVKFYSRGQGYELFLAPTEAVLNLSKAYIGNPHDDARSNRRMKPGEPGRQQTSVLRMTLKGANPSPEVKGIEELPGKVNYFAGKSRDKWHTDITTYAKVRYAEVYQGIDLIYYGNQRQLEYDFVVAPGADPAVISLRFEGAQHVKINDAGELSLRTKGGNVQMSRPVIYQLDKDGKREDVAGHYLIRNRSEIGIHIDDYDPNRTLVIDPVLSYSTYLGGTLNDSAYDITADAAGNAYITGTTYSTNFPVTSGAFQTRSFGQARTDAFVTKLNSVGNAAIYSTYLGGTSAVQDPDQNFVGPTHGNEEARGIVVDSAGNVFLTGTTTSTVDFPVTPGAYRTTFDWNGATSTEDAFVAKLNPTGNALIYSTRLGGRGSDQAFAIGIDNAGDAYVTGKTQSPDFPVTYGSRSSNITDAFVVKLNSTGTALSYSVLLGSGVGSSIAVDSSGNAYVAGQSLTSSFSVTPGAFQTVAPGGAAEGFLNGFVTKINPAGNALIYSTFLGGNRTEELADIAIDAAGNAYVGGFTDFHDYPTTPGAFMTIGSVANGALGGGPVVTKLNPTGSALIYSTYMVGSSIRGLVVNASGEVYVTGAAEANLITTNDGFQKTSGGSTDAFVAKLNAGGTALLYSTFLGGGGQDSGTAIAIDNAGSLYVTGLTFSANFPLTQDAFQTDPSGNQFGVGSFVAKIGEASTAPAYRIKGRLTDSNGNGLAGAQVKLVGSPEGTQFTNANGNYSFGSLTPQGSYSVTPISPYYEFNPQSRSFSDLNADQIADFSATARRFSISGSIKDGNGNPLEGVNVALSGAQSAATLTDVNGNYVLNDVSAIGNYTVTPSKTNYAFVPFRKTFTNLDGNQNANFSGILVYSIKGQVLDPTGNPVPGISITVSNGSGQSTVATNSTGNYLFSGLPAGVNYTVTPAHADYTFSPAAQNVDNLSNHVTVNFTATYRYGSIRGRVTDADGNPRFSTLITLSGAQNSSITSDASGNYVFSRLLKGNSYTVAASERGYSFSPASANITITGDHTVNFSGTLKKLKPFTSGNILLTPGIAVSSKYLAEYTPSGTLVQEVIVPYPTANNGNLAYYLGDLVVDKNGEAQIYNGSDATSYMTRFSFTDQAWRHQTYSGWNPWQSYHLFDGIATLGKYVYVTDKTVNDSGQPTQTQGIIRIDLDDYSSQRFVGDLSFCHLTVGQDGLLYGIVGGTSGSQIKVYDPAGMQLVKTVSLSDLQNSPINVQRIAVNSAGEFFATGFDVHHFDAAGKLVKSLHLPDNLTDIEIANDGKIAASTLSSVTLLDESLAIKGSFSVPTGVGHLAFTNTITSTGSMQFSAPSYTAGEGDGRVSLPVNRSGNTSTAATVSYVTSDLSGLNNCNLVSGNASSRCDYATSIGTLRFAAGESSKTIFIPLVDDNFTEGSETFTVTLSSPTGAPLGTNTTATITITDNDAATTPGNPLDQDAFFVRQHYIDLLGREPDTVGLAGWQNVLNQCGITIAPPCDRIEVSSGFFRSEEFQTRGYFIYRFYSAVGKIPLYEGFMPDLAKVSGFLSAQQLEDNKTAFVDEFMARADFQSQYGSLTDPTAYVNALLAKTGLPNHPGKQAWISGLTSGAMSRGQVLRALVESTEVYNKYYSEAFVIMQYFGYLRRSADISYLDWIKTMNSNGGDYRTMINGFLNSAEYRNRFGN